MKVKGLIWLGTRTSQFDQMLNLYHNVMGLSVAHQEPGFVVLDLPNGDRVEIFGDELKSLFHRMTNFRFALVWYLIAIFGYILLYLLVTGLSGAPLMQSLAEKWTLIFTRGRLSYKQ